MDCNNGVQSIAAAWPTVVENIEISNIGIDLIMRELVLGSGYGMEKVIRVCCLVSVFLRLFPSVRHH